MRINNPRVSKALWRCPPLAGLTIDWLKPIDGGLTNESYQLQCDRRCYLLRLNALNSQSLGLNRKLETVVLIRAEEAGLSPPLIYCDPGYEFIIFEYIKGCEWRLAEKEKPQQLAKLLRRIHDLSPVTERLDLLVKANWYWQEIDKNLEWLEELKHYKDKIESHIATLQQDDMALCLCHNDLQPQNIIYSNDKKIYVLDWEYAAMGHPFFDLAAVVDGWQLDRQQCNQLLSAYLQRAITDNDLQRLRDAKVAGYYMSLLWYAIQSPRLNSPAVQSLISSQLCGIKKLLAVSDGVV